MKMENTSSPPKIRLLHPRAAPSSLSFPITPPLPRLFASQCRVGTTLPSPHTSATRSPPPARCPPTMTPSTIPTPPAAAVSRRPISSTDRSSSCLSSIMPASSLSPQVTHSALQWQRGEVNRSLAKIDDDSEDPAKSAPSSPNSSTRKACCGVLQSWVSKKFMTGCVVLFPVAVTFFITWWFIQFVDGFFSPLYAQLGVNIFGLGFLTSLIFVFLMGIFVSSWLGSTVFWIGEWFIKRMPFVKHIYSASKQISTAISPDQNNTAFKEVAIIRHPRVGEYAFGFITSYVVLQTDKGDEELCSVYVPTNHMYIGDIFLVNSEEIIRPNLSIREGIEIIVSGGMTMPQVIAPQERMSHKSQSVRLNRLP